MKLRNKFSNCGPTVKGGQPTTWCRRQRFMFDKLQTCTSMVVGWTGEGGCQESTVKSVEYQTKTRNWCRRRFALSGASSFFRKSQTGEAPERAKRLSPISRLCLIFYKFFPLLNLQVKSVKAKWTDLRTKGMDLIPNRTFSTMRMIRHRTFPSKHELTNGGRGHQTTKNAKKQTQLRRHRHLLCVF